MRVVGNNLAQYCDLNNRNMFRKCGLAMTVTGFSATVFLLHLTLKANGGKLHKIELRDYGFLAIPYIYTMIGIAFLALSTEKVGKYIDQCARKTNANMEILIKNYWENPNYDPNAIPLGQEQENHEPVVIMSAIKTEEGEETSL